MRRKLEVEAGKDNDSWRVQGLPTRDKKVLAREKLPTGMQSLQSAVEFKGSSNGSVRPLRIQLAVTGAELPPFHNHLL